MEEVKKTDLLASKRIVEKETSESIQKEIASQWSKVLAYEGPYQLSNMFVEQQKMCSKLMETKNALLSEFTSELKSKDDEYVKELKRQAEEIGAWRNLPLQRSLLMRSTIRCAPGAHGKSVSHISAIPSE